MNRNLPEEVTRTRQFIEWVFRARMFLLPGLWLIVLAFVFASRANGQGEVKPPELTATESQQPEKWLRDRGLDGLLAIGLEEQLRRETDPSRQTEIARELAGLYGRLLSQRPGNADSIIAGWDRLVASHPEAIDLEASIQIEYGQLRLAQETFSHWKRTGGEEARHSIRERFSAIAGRVQELLEREQASNVKSAGESNQDVTQASDKGLVLNDTAASDETGFDPDQDKTAPTLTRAGARLAYLLAWSQLNQALLAPEPAAETELLSSALRTFRELLGITGDTTIRELRPQWFPLESDWNCRILVGLGTTCQASGNEDDARYCFSLLNEVRVPYSIRTYRFVFQLQAMADSGRIDLVDRWLNDLVIDGQATGALTELWRAAAAYGLGPRHFHSMASHYQAVALTALREMALLNDWSSIDLLFDDAHSAIDFPAIENDFFVKWLEGYWHLRAAQKNQGPGAVEAADRLRAALALAEKSSGRIPGGRQFELRARCRSHLGAALYLAGELQSAVSELEQAAGVLEYLDREAAEDAVWMMCQSLERLSGNDEAAAQALGRALKDFQSRFPGSGRIADATFMQTLAEVREHGTSGQNLIEAIRKLETIERSHPRYLSAQMEKCRLAHEHLSRPRSADNLDETVRDSLHGAVLQSAEEIVSSGISPPASPEQKVLISLMAADCLLSAVPPDTAAAERWLERAAEFVEPARMESQSRSEWYYLSLRVATFEKNRNQMAAYARWLADSAADSAQNRFGWYVLASLAEDELNEELSGLSDSVKSGRRKEIMELYGKAIDVPSVPPDATSLLALERLAALQVDAGETALALQLWQRLVSNDGRRADWWTGLARASTSLGDRDKAIEAWNRVASLQTPGNNEWLEARHEMCRILIETDPEAAARFIKQTLLLVPEMPEPWQSRFRELSNQR